LANLAAAKKTGTMKIKNETKVGLLTILALALLIMGFNFLKGKEIFNRSTKIYAVFEKLGPLEKSNLVKINGVSIGTVYDIEPTDKDISSVKVTISLTRAVNIPSNSVAYISPGLVGSSTVIIDKGDAQTFLKNGDLLNTRVDNGLLGDLSSQVSPTLVKIRSSLDSLNAVFTNINKLFDAGAKTNLQQTIANLNMATSSLNKMLDIQHGPLAGTLNNVNSITDNLKKNNDSITAILSNTKQFTQKLTSLDLQQTMDTLQSAITKLKSAIDKISSNEGTLGALINDRQLYNKLRDVMLSAEILLDDLRTHPKRYVNISVFGKKDKDGALTSPAAKDSVPRKK
jgi:phospholipid/cholesterol/gamma-HCH transport system substrate-binding protein